ncbi:MAG: ATP-binding protein [Deltaproteobacteria bacterium]|nr:ATP-binding protein [Deltaproteobacteria bacterium]
MIYAIICAAVAAFVYLRLRRKPLAVSSMIPVAEVSDSVVLNVDGSLACVFSLAPVEYVASGSSALASLANSLGAILQRLPDGATLQLILDVEDGRPKTVDTFMAKRRSMQPLASAADALLVDVAAHLEHVPFRDAKLFLCVCLPYEFQNAPLVRSGVWPKERPRWTAENYKKACKKLEQLASTVSEHLRSCGFVLELALDGDILALITKHINARSAVIPRDGRGTDASASDVLPDELRPLLTLRERLAQTSVEMPTPRTLRLGDDYVRTLSVLNLPDQTFPGILAPLYFELSGPARVAISIERLPTETTLAALKVRRSIAQSVSSLSPARNIDAEVQNNEIEGVMEALSQSSACLVAVQVTASVRGNAPDDVNARLLRLQEMLSRAGGFSTLVEDYAHLDVYLSQLPGAAHRFRRARTVLDANGAEIALPFGSWRGSPTGPLMLRTRSGDPVLFNPFDQRLPSYNGFIVGPMGSGKSFFTNLLLANHVANGGAAVVIDIGGSYRRLTSIFDGPYIDIGKADGIGLNPLPTLSELAALRPEQRDEKLQFLAGFLELLLSETGSMPTSERAIVTKALSAFYTSTFVAADTRPTLRDLQSFLVSYSEDGMDRQTAVHLARRFDLWVQGPRARLFATPVDLSTSPSLISIDLKAIESDKELQAVALYVLAFIIWSKVARDKRDTLVVIDECWALLDNPAATRLIESLVRTSRKYGAALWCITQRAEDLLQSGVGKVLVDCCFQRIFLQHASAHAAVGAAFSFTDHELCAFESLTQVKGRFSEAFLQVQNHSEVVQIRPSPLAYWMATTNAADKHVEEELRAKNPGAPQLKILRALADNLPHGVPVAA